MRKMGLAGVLERFTATPDSCWFGVWEGKGPLRSGLQAAPVFEVPTAPDVALTRSGPGRRVLSLRAPPVGRLGQSLVARDQAWCAGTEIDLMTTYVGGSTACIRAVLAEASLEAMPVSVDQSVTWDADTINPLPPSPFAQEP